MSDRLVVVAASPDALTAHSIRLLLEASGVVAFVTGDFPSETPIGNVLVWTREADKPLAIQIIDEVPSASEVLVPEWICDCGETVDAGFHLCWNCGREAH